MKLIRNSGNDRVIDRLREWLTAGSAIDFMTPTFSVHAFAETREFLDKADRCRLLLGDPKGLPETLFGGPADISYRNRLQSRWLARLAADWINRRCDVRHVPSALPQSLILVTGSNPRALLGTCSFTTGGLGITPGGQMGLVQATDTNEEASAFAEWFRSNWDGIKPDPDAKERLVGLLTEAASQRAPSLVYFQMLFQLFKDLGDQLDEERIIKSATGIRDTIVWKKLFRFQRDGVIGAIDKLERIGGCIIADSVGLGKTFEALAVI
jgi:hypothetical protein